MSSEYHFACADGETARPDETGRGSSLPEIAAPPALHVRPATPEVGMRRDALLAS
jgi:hypothetical protein